MAAESVPERVVELAKRRGFFLQSATVYGGVSGFYTYGPEGEPLKRNLTTAWRRRFVTQPGHQVIDAPTILPEAVFEASGHLDTFDDMLVTCTACETSHRADHLLEAATDLTDTEAMSGSAVEQSIARHDIACPNCGSSLAGEPVSDFNLMFSTTVGPGSSTTGYLRPETVQGIFVEFPQLREYARGQLPFGVTQIGRAYRNEISPRRSLLRTREFTQAELDLFIDPEEDEPSDEHVSDRTLRLYAADQQEASQGSPREVTVADAVDGPIDHEWIGYYLGVASEWFERVGVDPTRLRFREHLADELSHYASECWDAEAEIDGEWVELAGFSYRGDHDLTSHASDSGERFSVFKQWDEPREQTVRTVDPDMSYLGPTFGDTAVELAEQLEELAKTEPERFEGSAVSLTVDGDSYEIPAEHTGFTVETRTETGVHITPHVVEPSFGIDRLLYTVLCHNYREDEQNGERRRYLSLPADVAPTAVGVFPLVNEAEIADRARRIERALRDGGFAVTYDESGGIGRRYRRQDEIGTPFCVTVDRQTLDDDTATIRERDTTAQRRVPTDQLQPVLTKLRDAECTLTDLTQFERVE